MSSAGDAAAWVPALRDRWSRVIVGQAPVLERMLVALLIRGHVLLEGVPGTAKTLSVKVLARCLGLPFGRIQLTPDLLPADLVGTGVWDPRLGDFRVRQGPVFTTVLLADEINRAPARTQAALLEAMEERQVTLEGSTRPLPDLFTVFATQNPVEHEGTYPLPEAQLDRFALHVRVPYPSEADERLLLEQVDRGVDPAARWTELVGDAVVDGAMLAAAQRAVAAVRVAPEVREFLMGLVRATRAEARLALGASPRAGMTLLRAAKALAFLQGRPYATPDDVVALAPDVLRHRVVLHGEAVLAGLDADDILTEVAHRRPVPR